MKRFFLVLGLIFALLFGALLIAPLLFKDKLKALLLTEINKNLQATVHFDDIDLSFIRRFPDAALGLKNYSVVGQDIFETDTLISGNRFDLVIDLMSIFRGDEITVREVVLNAPRIRVLVLEDGTANYDIVKSSEEAEADTTETSGSFKVSLKRYAIEKGNLYYSDATYPMLVTIGRIDHSGGGDFTEDVFDLVTKTQLENLLVSYAGVDYLQKARVEADIKTRIQNLPESMKISLMENKLEVNAFNLSLEGAVGLFDDYYDLDLTFKSNRNDFRGLYSIVPGAYRSDFDQVKIDGELTFDGFAKGVYSETQYPGFGLRLQARDGRVQYPDLPEPLSDIQLDMNIQNETGNLESTTVNIRRLHLLLGKNPVDAKLNMSGLERITLSGALEAKLDLEEVTRVFPVEGTALRGSFLVKAEADGVYDEARKTFPKVMADMRLKDGYLKNAEYPAELTNLTFEARISDEDGTMKNAILEVPAFSFLLDNEPLSGRLRVVDFDDPQYEISANGTLDLEKLTTVYPLDSMTLEGKILVDQFQTRGRYSDVEAERYDQLPTSGTVRLENFFYTDPEMSAPLKISSGQAVFNPQNLTLTDVQGTMGRTDFALDGQLNNYLAYALMEDAPLQGDMRLRSKKIDLNEFMTEEETVEEPESADLEVIPVPANLDLTFAANIGEVIYQDLTLRNMKGELEVADEQLNLHNLNFNMLGGTIGMSGLYATRNPKKPDFNFLLNAGGLKVQEAASYFSIVQNYAPIAKNVKGLADLNVELNGKLRPNMMPDLGTVNALGLFQLAEATLTSSNLMNLISEKVKLPFLQNPTLQNLSGKFKIENGALTLAPMPIQLKDGTMTIDGQQSLGGDLRYGVALDLPSGALGASATSAINNLLGTTVPASDRVKLDLAIGGTLTNPKITGVRSETAEEVKGQLTAAAQQKLKEETGLDVPLSKDSIKAEVKKVETQVRDTVKTIVEDTRKQVEDSLRRVAEQKALEAQKAAEEELKKQLGEEGQKQLDQLKNLFGKPKKKKDGG